MNWLKTLLLALVVIAPNMAMAQTENSAVAYFFSNGKWAVVFAVAGVIVLGLLLYVMALRKEHKKLQQRSAAVQSASDKK